VGALVEQSAAAVLLPAAPPAAAGVVGVGAVPVGHRPADPLDAAQFAAVHQLPDGPVGREGPLLKDIPADQPRRAGLLHPAGPALVMPAGLSHKTHSPRS